MSTKSPTIDEVKEGMRIELIYMPNDPRPVPAGSKGTVIRVHKFPCPRDGMIGQIGVNWDNGRTLSMVLPEDKFRILES